MKTSWGKVAGWYDELLEKHEGTYQKEVILPNLIRIMGFRSGNSGKGLPMPSGETTVLDLACGQGFFSRELARLGLKVIASDIAKELIEIARTNPDPVTKNITYHIASASDLSFCPSARVDVVTIVLALQNIEDLTAVMQECARVLKRPSLVQPHSAGKLFIVLNHPAFRIPKRSSWQWDHVGKPGAGTQYRCIDAYMSESRERIDMTPGEDRATSKKYTASFHRPLQVYFKALTKAGFVVSRLEEWVSHKQSKPGPRADEENRIRKEIPMFLALEARLS
jgi:SAM-dependent methyltransferase